MSSELMEMLSLNFARAIVIGDALYGLPRRI